MAQWLKRGLDDTERRELDAAVRQTVEDVIRQVERDGDAAVRALSVKFDRWDRDDYRLSPAEIQAKAKAWKP